MLDLGCYLLGVLQVAILAGAAWLGASAVRRRLLPDFEGASARLATAVLALALLIWVAELLGSVGLFERWPYLLSVAACGLGAWAYFRGAEVNADDGEDAVPGGGASMAIVLGALLVAAVAVVKFAVEVKAQLGTGMTGFDSTWYHGPFAAGFFQSGDTWSLHFIAPQFLAWFYPANSELFHAAGMLAFDRDLLSPLLNLGWFLGCLLACWCIGRPYGAAPWSLALGAIALSVPAFADQAGEARNDVVGTFFLLAAVAVALEAYRGSIAIPAGSSESEGGRALSGGALVVVGLAAGLAAGAKLNFLLPAGVLVAGLALAAPAGARLRALGLSALAALAGGGYWYLRNLAHAGNPLPWVKDIGPISLPAPEQALGGREGHSVFGYLTDGAVWSDWLLPGLRDGLWIVWPLLLALCIAGLLLCVGRRSTSALRIAGLVGLATALAWLIAPTSASGPDGMPRGFESGLRYLVPALALGAALLPAALTTVLSGRFGTEGMGSLSNGRILKAPPSLGRRLSGREGSHALAVGLVLLAIVTVAIGYSVQRHYLENRYAKPTFTASGLNAAFAWARGVEDARIATTSTRQYPLFGTDLSNRVEFVGVEQPHGGFTAVDDCRSWRRFLAEGDYDYVVASRDRIEPRRPPYPASAAWTEGPGATAVLREPPTIVFRLAAPPDPSTCP